MKETGEKDKQDGDGWIDGSFGTFSAVFYFSNYCPGQNCHSICKCACNFVKCAFSDLSKLFALILVLIIQIAAVFLYSWHENGDAKFKFPAHLYSKNNWCNSGSINEIILSKKRVLSHVVSTTLRGLFLRKRLGCVRTGMRVVKEQ